MTIARLSRRGFTLGGAAVFAGCRGGDCASQRSGAVADDSRGSTRLVTWDFEGAISPRAVALVPTWGGAGARFPVLVALHGRGEARKSPADGALGWARDYALGHAIERVATPPLGPDDFEGFVDASRLDALNRALAAAPFGGLIVVCPYLPDLDTADETALAAFGAFVTGPLVERARRELPALPHADATGIDGVSLGGAVALRVGLRYAASFGAVGALQPALDAHQAARWVSDAQTARRANASLALRLLTSDGDFFRPAVVATSDALSAGGVAHELEIVRGPHDYAFNRGPGAIEMLAWHDRVLRRSRG